MLRSRQVIRYLISNGVSEGNNKRKKKFVQLFSGPILGRHDKGGVKKYPIIPHNRSLPYITAAPPPDTIPHQSPYLVIFPAAVSVLPTTDGDLEGIALQFVETRAAVIVNSSKWSLGRLGDRSLARDRARRVQEKDYALPHRSTTDPIFWPCLEMS